MAQPTALLDSDGMILSCNDEFKGCAPAKGQPVVGQLITQIVKPSDRAAIKATLARADPNFESTVALSSGLSRLTLTQIPDDTGAICYLCQISPEHAIDNARLRFLVEHLDQGVWTYNVQTDTFTVTDAWRRLRGLPSDMAPGSGTHNWTDELHPNDEDLVMDTYRAQMRGDAPLSDIQYRCRHAKGHWIWIHCRANMMITDQAGQPVQVVGVDNDITSLKQREAEMAQSVAKTQLAIDIAGLGVWEFDVAKQTVYWDDRLLEIYGLTDDENHRAGDLWETYLHPEDRDAAVRAADGTLEHKTDFESEYRIVRPSGEIRHLRSLARFVKKAGAEGKLQGVNIDITDEVRRRQELEIARQQLEYDSRHDALTGLANRRLLDETAQKLLKRLGPNDPFAVLHLDLDHFKQLNDTLGHAAGDAALVHVGDALRHLVGQDGLVTRNGGDEFVVLLYDAPSPAVVGRLCQAIIDRIAEPLNLGDQVGHCGVSIGAAISYGGAEDAAEVFINADVALYEAKSDGRSNYKLFKPGMTPTSQRDAAEQHCLRMALSKGEITCHYQPQFDALTREIVGAEALVRWNCPERGLVAPDDFMEIARKGGLALEIDELIFQLVLDQQTRWAAQGVEVPRVSVNVSRERLEDVGLVTRVTRALLPHHSICFELLETAFLDNPSAGIRQTLLDLRAAGVGIELDDFGSGHSSVVALQALRPDRVKIDRRLVQPVSHRDTQILTLRALTQLAAFEGAGVIVEGIETEAELEAIAELECDMLQGFVLGRPMPADAFAAFLDPVPQVTSKAR